MLPATPQVLAAFLGRSANARRGPADDDRQRPARSRPGRMRPAAGDAGPSWASDGGSGTASHQFRKLAPRSSTRSRPTGYASMLGDVGNGRREATASPHAVPRRVRHRGGRDRSSTLVQLDRRPQLGGDSSGYSVAPAPAGASSPPAGRPTAARRPRGWPPGAARAAWAGDPAERAPVGRARSSTATSSADTRAPGGRGGAVAPAVPDRLRGLRPRWPRAASRSSPAV